MSPQKPRISFVVALGRITRAIGKDSGLIWHLPEDMKHFKRLTEGHPVIMGRKTWDSLPAAFKPLPHRTNIVISRADVELEGATLAHSVDEALSAAAAAPGNEEVLIIGGGEIYNLFMPVVDRLYLTLVDDDTDGDAHFPPYDEFTKVIEEERHDGSPSYTFVTLER